MPDVGLRVSKKQRTRVEILANAVALFRKQGVRRTRTSEIARASGVSPGTLFNYFPTKGAIAEAWVRGEVEEVLAVALAASGDRGLRAIFRMACRDLASRSDDEEGPLRLEAWRTLGRARAERRTENDPLVHMVRSEQERERIRQDLSAEVLADMLVDAIEAGIVDAIDHRRPGRPEKEIARALQARVDLVLDGARKRNERVAAPSVTARAPNK